jgi:uncharacterized protein YjbJ (UPF0337 family)
MNDRGTAKMGGEIDQVKRRIKKAAGVLADDDSLPSEGEVDQVVGKEFCRKRRLWEQHPTSGSQTF